MTTPRTEAGRSLIAMFRTEEGPRRTRWPRYFDARLAERIVEDFVLRIEAQARRWECEDALDQLPVVMPESTRSAVGSAVPGVPDGTKP